MFSYRATPNFGFIGITADGVEWFFGNIRPVAESLDQAKLAAKDILLSRQDFEAVEIYVYERKTVDVVSRHNGNRVVSEAEIRELRERDDR